jgi:hypothetical protein
MEKIYKGQTITLNEATGKFDVKINGRTMSFASLKSAMNQVDKNSVVDFKPQEVLIVEESGYGPARYSVKKVRLIGYYEEKGHRGSLQRYFKVQNGSPIKIGRWGDDIFPLSALKKLTANVKENTAQELAQSAAEKAAEKAKKQREDWSIDLDPHPELA